MWLCVRAIERMRITRRNSEGADLASLWVALRHLHLHHLVGLDPWGQLHLEGTWGRLLLLLLASTLPSRIARDVARTPCGANTWGW